MQTGVGWEPELVWQQSHQISSQIFVFAVHIPHTSAFWSERTETANMLPKREMQVWNPSLCCFIIFQWHRKVMQKLQPSPPTAPSMWPGTTHHGSTAPYPCSASITRWRGSVHTLIVDPRLSIQWSCDWFIYSTCSRLHMSLIFFLLSWSYRAITELFQTTKWLQMSWELWLNWRNTWSESCLL